MKQDGVIVPVQEDENGELYIELPQHMLNEVGWEPEDTLEWRERGDGSWMIVRLNDDDASNWPLWGTAAFLGAAWAFVLWVLWGAI